jgi:predicted Zn-dependent peptidase
VDLEAACAHHHSSFSNPAEFTIVLTGNTSLEAVMPLLTRYLATIPAAEGRGGRLDPRNLKPLPFRFPENPVVEDVEVRPFGGGMYPCLTCTPPPDILC